MAKSGQMASLYGLQFSKSASSIITSCKFFPRIFTVRHLNTPKKFFKCVSITQSNGVYEINLDNRKLKTPLGKIFQVPSEPLAIAVAHEWEVQDKIINLPYMHLTGLCNTVLDNPTDKTLSSLSDELISFLDTDTICYRQDDPRLLAELQRNEWDPILQWFNERFDVEVNTSNSLTSLIIPSTTKQKLKRHFVSYNIWALTGIHFCVEALKSVILSTALVNRFISVEKAVTLTRLELEFQINHWGNVEWAHDFDLMDLRARAAAGVLFAHLNSNSLELKQKIDRKAT